MKNFHIVLGVITLLFSIWFIINSGEISEINEIKEIANQQNRKTFKLPDKKQQKLDHFILDISEIKTRGCSAGAKFISLKCAFPDKIAEYTLGNNLYQEIFVKSKTEVFFKKLENSDRILKEMLSN